MMCRRVLVCVGMLFCILAIVLCARLINKSDDATYHDLQQTSRSFAFWNSLERGRFGGAFRPLRMTDRSIRLFNKTRDRLPASGYLTNVSFAVTDAKLRQGQLVRTLDAATTRTDALIVQFKCLTNSVAITCRPKDVQLMRQALEMAP